MLFMYLNCEFVNLTDIKLKDLIKQSTQTFFQKF